MVSLQWPRALPRAVRKPTTWPPSVLSLPSRRQHTATAATVEIREQEPYLPEAGTVPPSTRLERRDRLRDAKPFSEFLTDTFDRQHDYLRISLTERCNLRCTYCMPSEGIQLSPDREILTTPEIYYLSALFVSQGVSKIRLTGGEPTVRKDIVPLMQRIGSLRRNGLKELALTTNGISLHRKLDEMVEAGLTGVNISLDTLDPLQFPLLTRRNGFNAVMKSINRVQELNKLGAGVKLKINCVAMRGINDEQILKFVEMTREQDVEVRFIEYMPFGGNKWAEKKMLPYAEMVQLIQAQYPTLTRLRDAKNDTSKTWQVPGFKGRVGFITSMTHNFCGTCNRLRITSDGNLKVCLHGDAEVSLRDLLRTENSGEPMDEYAFEAIRQIELDRRKTQQAGLRFDGEEGWISKERQLLEVIGAAVKRKAAKHADMGDLEKMKNRPMILIGKREITHSSPTSVHPTLRRHGSSPWATIPIHLLRATPGSLQARHYSSSGGKDDDRQSSSTEAESASPSSLTTSFGFQSLSGLFEQPKRGRHSTTRGSQQQPDAAPSPEASEHLANTGSEKLVRVAEPFFNRNNPVAMQDEDPSRIKSPSSADARPAELNAGSGDAATPKITKETNPDASLHAASSITTRRPIKDHAKNDETSMIIGEAFRKRFAASDDSESSSPGHSGTRHTFTIKRYVSRDPEIPVVPKRANPFLAESRTQAERSGDDKRMVPPHTVSPPTKNPWGVSKGFQAHVNSLPERKINVAVSDREAIESLFDLQQSKEDAVATSNSTATPPLRVATHATTNPPGRFERSRPTGSLETKPQLTHVTGSGEARMVDVGAKQDTHRVAVATAFVKFSNPETLRLIQENNMKKGDVLGIARIAGIMAAKRTSDLIPLCHPLAISKVEVHATAHAPRKFRANGYLPGSKNGFIAIQARVDCVGPTGVEMEALTAATAASLTIYDMCKAVDKAMVIISARVVYKSGGRSGLYEFEPWTAAMGREWFAENGLVTEWSAGVQDKPQSQATAATDENNIEMGSDTPLVGKHGTFVQSRGRLAWRRKRAQQGAAKKVAEDCYEGDEKDSAKRVKIKNEPIRWAGEDDLDALF